MGNDPKIPLRADHRFLKKLISSTLGGKVEQVPEEYDMLTRAFARAGGSWERIFQGGSPADVILLSRLIKRAFAKGLLTKKHEF